MLYFYLKAFHIIGFVSWFAGLFYLVRLFVYHAEAFQRPEMERKVLIDQYEIMEGRLYSIITTPAMIFTVICGVAMLVINPVLMKEGWMHIKLTLLLLLIAYHFYCGATIRRFQEGKVTTKPFHFRLLNEAPTLLLISIATLAVLKNQLNPLYLLLCLILLGIFFFIAAKLYKRKREKE